MNWNTVTNAVFVLVAIGAVSSVMLVIASRFMSLPTDERADMVLGVLPGANCGACGYAGCADYAAAAAKGAPNNLCIPGGGAAAAAIAEIMGEKADEVAARVAVVRCRGYCGAIAEKYDYIGVKSCRAVSNYYKGEPVCSYGCLGFGDCVAVCKFGAMRITGGVARSDFNFCNGCGACVGACPKQTIELLPLGKKAVVFCDSNDRGAAVRKICENGCIGCGLCVKACRYGAVRLVNNLAVVDNEICTGCEKCVAVCPTKAIGILYRTEMLDPLPAQSAEEWEDDGAEL